MRKFTTPLNAIRNQLRQSCLSMQRNQLHTTDAGKNVDSTVLASALTAAVNSNSISQGTRIHGHVVKLGFTSDLFSCNNLIGMYSKLGALDRGLKVFEEMPERNVVSWTLIITGAAQCGSFELGMKAFSGMVRFEVRPNEFSFGSVMKLCSARFTNAAFCIHCFAVKIGMEENPFVCSSLLNFYAKSGDMGSAEQIFLPCMGHLDAGCWNAMIGGYVLSGQGKDAMEVLSMMRQYEIRLDEYTYINCLKGCVVTGDLQAGKVIHGLIIQGKEGHKTDVVNVLLDMYFKSGENDSALKVFDRIRFKDVISWNSVFAGFCPDEDDYARDIGMFFNAFMLSGLRPNSISFTGLFNQCSRLCDLKLGLQFCSLSIQLGHLNDEFVASSLIDMLCKCEAMEMAETVFETVATRNMIIWNAMIRGYGLNGCHSQALDVYNKSRQLELKVNEHTFSSVLEASCGIENSEISKQIHGALIKFGFGCHGHVYCSLIKAYRRTDLLPSINEILKDLDGLDITSWSAMVSSLVRDDCYHEAFKVLNCFLQEGKKPDEFILGSILSSCASIAASRPTSSVHSLVLKTGFQVHPFVASALVVAYAKSGEINCAESVFNWSFVYGDSVFFNSMIMGYAHHGLVNKALETLEYMTMADIQPSLPTFVSVISACSHLGQVDLGLYLFNSIGSVYRLKPSPDVYGCVVDMLSRYGFLEDAKYIIQAMPFPPWPAIWRSLLSGCRKHGNIDLGVWTAGMLMRWNPSNDATYVLLSKMYSELSHGQDATEVKREMASRGMYKEPGCSYIEV